MASALDLLLFHRLERDCYHRLVRDLDQEQESMRWVMALWLWFESTGHHDFVRRVSALPSPVVLRFVDEAVACLSRLVRREHQGSDALPCTNALLNEPIDGVGYFDVNREEVMDGVSTVYKNVCRVIFHDIRADDDAYLLSRAPGGGGVSSGLGIGIGSGSGIGSVCGGGIGSGSGGDALLSVPRASPAPMVMAPYVVSSPVYAFPTVPLVPLNAMATPWFPPVQQPTPLPDDYRSLFITFSRGYPISKEDITEFFNSVYGPCVEAVMIERAPPGQQPVYGRVVMRTPAMIPLVLDGQQTAKYMIKGRHLWARVYVPSSRPLPVYI